MRCGQQHSATNEKGPDRSGPGFAVSESKRRLPATAIAIAAVAAIAAIAAEASAARTTTAGAWLILGFINAQRSAVHRITVQTLDRTRRISLAQLRNRSLAAGRSHDPSAAIRQEQQPRSGRGHLTSRRCRYPVTMIATRTVNDRFSFYHRYLNFKLAMAGRDGAILSA
jgi:hypothetical protein